MRSSGAILLGVTVLLTACNKGTPATADSATVAAGTNASFDKDAARAEILRADSAWLRHIQAKNVDSLMTYYSPDIVSMQEGTKMARGTSAVRAAYNEMVKTPMQNPAITTGDVDFSSDGTMGYDHGTFTATMNVKGKPVKVGGNYLNVWKKAGGRWVMVAEMSNSDQGM